MRSSSQTEPLVRRNREWAGNTEIPHSRSLGPLDGVTVLVITSGHEATDPRIYAKQACSLQRLGAAVTVVGKLERGSQAEVRVMTVPKPSSRLMRFLWQPWRCLWNARWQQADIIHFHDAEMLITLPLAKLWWFGSKFVYDVHEDFANLMLVRDWLPSWIKPAIRVLTNTMEKSFAALTDGVIGVTRPLTDKFANENRIVAYNYISRDFFERAARESRRPQDREFDIVHLGTLNLKRAIFLADTIREFHSLRPGARSLVVGVSPDIEEAMRPRIPNECVLLGKLPYDQIPAMLGNTKVGLDVHPWPQSHLRVALPVKVCEYMTAGCGVVSSSMPVLNQILHEAGAGPNTITIIDGGTPIEYASEAARLVESIDGGADPGARLHDLALKHMTWEGEAEKIAGFYLNLLGKPCAI